MRLIIVHYHWRLGGVRRLVETTAAAAANAIGAERVLLLSGEPPEEGWWRYFERCLLPRPVTARVITELSYLSELVPIMPNWRRAWQRRLEEKLDQVRGARHEPVVWWVHNAAVGRNPLASDGLARYAARRGDRVLWHQHDFWFDHRWERRRDFPLNGYHTTEAAVAATLPLYPRQAQLTLHEATTARLEKAQWPTVYTLPNPLTKWAQASPEAITEAKDWVDRRRGHPCPFWLMPSRIMRRKNLLEAALILQIIQPTHALVVTSSASSVAEHHYAEHVERLAQQCGLPLMTNVTSQAGAPSVPALLGACAGVLSTSLFEGYGLTPYEAAAAGKRVITRLSDPSSSSSLQPHFSTSPSARTSAQKSSLVWPYHEVMVPTELLGDYLPEQQQLYELWCLRHLSGRLRRITLPPPWWGQPVVPFSRLTQSDQEKIFRALPHHRKVFFTYNPWLLDLADWINQPMPEQEAPPALSLSRWADRFAESLTLAANSVPPRDHRPAAWLLATTHLRQGNHFPLLWSEAAPRFLQA